MRIHLVVNTHRLDAVSAAKSCAKWLGERDIETGADAESARLIGCEAVASDKLGEADLVVTYGGDGTLIRAAQYCSERSTPLLGVYYGRFGFVTQCLGAEVQQCLEHFFEGKAQIESRMMLQTDLVRGGEVLLTLHSLNELVMQRGVAVRIMNFSVFVDGEHLTTYPADGVMVSTPTGSTGYNLSAGGPIIVPGVEAMLVTPLAPHTLVARSVVLPVDSQVKLVAESHGEAVLSADSQVRLHLISGDEVRVKKSPRITRLIAPRKNDFLTKLRSRVFTAEPGGLI